VAGSTVDPCRVLLNRHQCAKHEHPSDIAGSHEEYQQHDRPAATDAEYQMISHFQSAVIHDVSCGIEPVIRLALADQTGISWRNGENVGLARTQAHNSGKMQAQKSRRQQGALIHQYSRQSAGEGERGCRNNLPNLNFVYV
jgi:hypothetical protein